MGRHRISYTESGSISTEGQSASSTTATHRLMAVIVKLWFEFSFSSYDRTESITLFSPLPPDSVAPVFNTRLKRLKK